MRLEDEDPGAVLALTAAGVTVVLDPSHGRLPAVVHWGHALPVLDAEQSEALIVGSLAVAGSNTQHVPPRVAVLPEHHTGWSGRPDHDRRYRVRPVLVGSVPSGLQPPPWWGETWVGTCLTGAALEHVGLACPLVHPDQVLLYRADSMEDLD